MGTRLRELNIQVETAHVVSDVDASGARGYPVGYPEDAVEWPADALVLATTRRPRTGLYRDLTADAATLSKVGIESVFRVGDCVAARPQLADAIFDAHRLAREIDSDDPQTPRPWIEEGRFIGSVDRDFDDVLGPWAPVRPNSQFRVEQA